jgi:hypothetical protein
MRRQNYKKVTPKVVGGHVLRKNNHKLTPNFWNTVQKDVQIHVEKPGRGFKHFLIKRDVIKFISIIPEWDLFSRKLDAIVLSEGGGGADGYYNNDGVIEICAWEKQQDILLNSKYFIEHKELFERLKIKYEQRGKLYFCEFSQDQIKAFQFLHILLHELGHHVDRIFTRSKNQASRGEDYAETFAFATEEEMFNAYQDLFNIVF